MKNSIKKLYRLILVIGAICITISCSRDDLLEKTPVTGLSASTIESEGDIISLTNGVYDAIQTLATVGAETHMFPVMFQDIRADNCISQWASFWTFGIPFDDFSLIQPNNSNIAAMWGKWFTAIARANTAIDFAQNFKGFATDGLQDRLIAESQFIRALSYFELVKHFGGVPLITQAISGTDADLSISRSSASEVYAQIVSDLEAARSGLPVTYTDGNDLGRATSGAAIALLAKVHLYQENYAEVVQLTEQLMQDPYSYVLESSFADNWALGNEYGQESIFEIGYEDGFSSAYFEAGGATNQGSSSYQMFGYIFANNGTFGNGVPRQSLIDLYNDGDSRKDATFITPETDYYELGVQSCGCAVNPDGTFNFDTESQWVGTDIYNYFWTNPDALESRASMRKYDVPPTVGGGLLELSNSPLNEKYLRYADVLLMHAEASLFAGGDGLSSLNQVIERAYGSSDQNLASYTIEDVKLERRKELATEGWDRFTDLVRWGDAANALAFKGFTAGRDELLPIPQSEIDVVGTSVLSQNPGY